MVYLLSMHLRFVQVDAFTSEPFKGNPAAVCVLTQPIDEARMQNIAREMNLSETAFLNRRPDGSFDLRWFTPAVEVALCGHATLASAHALWEAGQLQANQIAQFHTKSGLLTATHTGDWIELNFPSTPSEPCEAPPEMLEALGVSAKYVGKSKFDYLVEVDSEATVRGATPDFGRLRKLPVRGVMMTAPAAPSSSGPSVDFVSRFFAPGSGIDEDPATGSSHCCLTPYWAGRLGKTEMIAQQLSSRGGVLRVKLDGDRVLLAGQAVTVLKGEILS